MRNNLQLENCEGQKHSFCYPPENLAMISIKTIGDPVNDRPPMKSPMPAHFFCGNFSLLSQSVNRRTRNFEQFRSFIDGQDF